MSVRRKKIIEEIKLKSSVSIFLYLTCAIGIVKARLIIIDKHVILISLWRINGNNML